MQNPILLDVPERIETARLTLRSPMHGDGPALYEAVADSLAELREFLASLPWAAGVQSVQLSEIYCRNAHFSFIARQDMPFLIFERSTSMLVGCVGLHRPDWHTPKVELGYWCRSTRAGNGFMTEAVLALLQVAEKNLAAARVELRTDASNLRSRALAERCGFVLEGVLRCERRAPDGQLRDTCMYARTSTALSSGAA